MYRSIERNQNSVDFGLKLLTGPSGTILDGTTRVIGLNHLTIWSLAFFLGLPLQKRNFYCNFALPRGLAETLKLKIKTGDILYTNYGSKSRRSLAFNKLA